MLNIAWLGGVSKSAFLFTYNKDTINYKFFKKICNININTYNFFGP